LEKLKIYLNNLQMKKIIVISGATASGKTAKAVEFCRLHNGEIISADSRQIYKYLDIGTNKEGVLIHSSNEKAAPRQYSRSDEMGRLIETDGNDGRALRKINRAFRLIGGVPQYLTDLIEPSQTYSAADFAEDADAKIAEISSRGKLPVIVGGTGLYVKALLYGLDKMPAADEKLRKELSKKTQSELYNLLLKLDKGSAEKNQKNPQRLLRALEVNILSGKTMGEHFTQKNARYDFIHYTLCVENKILYAKINERCKKMLESGMIEETQKVLNMGFDENCPALSGIGYRDVIKFLNGKISKETLCENFSKDTRRYAKRQNTWFKAQKEARKTEF
jgi:tRNA dimethylallyltransferase